MLYERIKELCRINYTNVKQLEKSLGFANGYIQKWKTSHPNYLAVKKVADFFGMTIDELISEEVTK